MNTAAEIKAKELVDKMESAMSKFGEVHTLLARTKLPANEYNEMSAKFSEAKTELFYYWQSVKSSLNKI